MRDLELARLVEFTEGAAYADMLRSAPSEWRCVAEDTPAGWFLLAPTRDLLLFNRIVGSGLREPIERDTLDTLIARYRDAGLRSYGVQLSPSAQPQESAEWIAANGLAVRDRWAKMYRSVDAPVLVETNLRIEAVSESQRELFGDVVAIGFGMSQMAAWMAATFGRPQWHHYLAWDGVTAVAGAKLFVDGDVGWLGVASTLPPSRRRGAQSALLHRRIEDARALGCRWVITETGEETLSKPNPSFRNMIRAGFTLAYHRPNFMPV